MNTRIAKSMALGAASAVLLFFGICAWGIMRQSNLEEVAIAYEKFTIEVSNGISIKTNPGSMNSGNHYLRYLGMVDEKTFSIAGGARNSVNSYYNKNIGVLKIYIYHNRPVFFEIINVDAEEITLKRK